MKINTFIVILLACFALFARDLKKASEMRNTKLIYSDSILVDADSVEWTQAFSVDEGAYLHLEIEAREDSTAGFANDSAAVSVELYQLCPEWRNKIQYWKVFKSKAHPDSTYPGTDWFLWDSLDIADMDTAAVWMADTSSITQRGGGPRIKIFGDSLVILDTTDAFGALTYIDFAPDFSPALALKLTGLANNLKRGAGSMWIIKVYQMAGEPVEVE